MAIIERWFSTTSAGSGDGTSWANRAALFNSGNWSSIITGFNFSVDSLVAYVGPGTYSNTQQLNSGLFTNAPTQTSVGRLSFVGCNSSGVRLSPNNPDWICAQGPLDVTGYPVIETNQNIFNTSVCVNCEFFVITRPSGNASVVQSVGGSYRWCRIVNTSSGTSATTAVSTTSAFANCEFECTGTSFSAVATAPLSNNIRVIGNPAATSGPRVGLSGATPSGPIFVSGCQVGIRPAATGTSAANTSLFAYRLTAVDCNIAIELPTASSGGTACLTVFGCMIANCTTGVTQPFGRYELANTRLRNTTNVSPANSLPLNEIFDTSGSDADEFVDAANGDYRIKNTSIYWGRGIGAGDEPAAGGGGIPIGRIISGGV
jgi:hypothetical protein